MKAEWPKAYNVFLGGLMEHVELNTERIRTFIEDPKSLDKATYDWLVRNVKRLVRRLLHSRRLDSLHPATAVADDALMKAVEHFKRTPLNGRDHFVATMVRIAQHVVWNLYHSENSYKRGGRIERVPFDEARDVDDSAANKDLLEMRETIRWLSQKSVELPAEIGLLVERYVLERTLEECAAARGISVSTVQRKLKTILGMLRSDVGAKTNA